MNETDIEYPIRINKYLYKTGYCSRREADRLIEEGQIKINGKLAVLGQKVEASDSVEMSDKVKRMPENYAYFILNKPRGVVSHNPQDGEKSAEDFFTEFRGKKLAPIGRLDKDSFGLMLMTNDGRIVDKMLNPKYDHEKEYVVRVDKVLKESFVRKMEKGVDIEGYMTKPCQVKQTGEKSFRIILTEGKKHQIRRMCVALGYQVKELKRVRIMNLRLGNLHPGQTRELKMQERVDLLKNVGLM